MNILKPHVENFSFLWKTLERFYWFFFLSNFQFDRVQIISKSDISYTEFYTELGPLVRGSFWQKNF